MFSTSYVWVEACVWAEPPEGSPQAMCRWKPTSGIVDNILTTTENITIVVTSGGIVHNTPPPSPPLRT